MTIALTYDLRDDYLAMGYTREETAEFDKEETIAGIENALRDLGYSTIRIGNIFNLVKAIAKGEKWDLVFNIAEGMYGLAREAQIPALLDAYSIPYVFSDGLCLALTLHKGYTKHVIQNAGIPTANFLVVNSPAEITNNNLAYPLFIKPASEGTGKGINEKSLVENYDQLVAGCMYLLETFHQPVLVEEYLPGREFTVGITGTGSKAKVIGIMEICQRNPSNELIYSLDNKENYEQVIDYKIPSSDLIKSCSKVALDAWKLLNCRDGGRIDLRLDKKGIPNFIEVNPLAGLNPIHSDLPILCRLNGITYQQLMKEIIDSAIKRIFK